MEELFHYKYLSIKVEELDIQLKDAMAKFKIDFKDYIVNNDEKPNQNNNNDENIDDNQSQLSDYSYSSDENNTDDNISNENIEKSDGENEINKESDKDKSDEDIEEEKNKDIDKNKNNETDDTVMERKKKKKRRKRKEKKELSEKEKLILRLYRKLSKILHPDKNPSCKGLFLKLKKYYDENNLIEIVIIANLFDIPIESNEINPDEYKKDIEELDKKMNNINNNFIWMLYYGTPQQRQLVRQRLMEKLK